MSIIGKIKIAHSINIDLNFSKGYHNMKTKLSYFLLLLLLLHLVYFPYVTNATALCVNQNPLTMNLSDENKKIAQNLIMGQILEKYAQNKTFPEIQKYMTQRLQDFKRTRLPQNREFLITETFARSQSVYERTKPFVGHSFNSLYKPQAFEELVEKYLWLKGICFFVIRH